MGTYQIAPESLPRAVFRLSETRVSEATIDDNITFGILGKAAVRIDGDLVETWGSLRLRAMLATLLVHAGRSVSTDTLVSWVWPEDTVPHDPIATFHTYATRIRKTLRQLPNPPTLHAEHGRYQLNIGHAVTDYGQFRTLTSRARTRAHTGAYDDAADNTGRALALWRGRALDDVRTDDAEAWRTWVLRNELIPAIAMHVDALIKLGKYGEALTRLDELTAGYPRNLTLTTLRLSALHGLSRYTERTEHYLTMRRLFLHEDGDEQAAEHVRRHHDTLRAEPTDTPMVITQVTVDQLVTRLLADRRVVVELDDQHHVTVRPFTAHRPAQPAIGRHSGLDAQKS